MTIPGFGNCGFEALSYVTKKKNQSIDHLALRISCVQYIRDHIEEMREKLENYLLISPHIRHHKKRNLVRVGNIDELLRWMSQEGTYIEEFCFPVMCQLLRNICTFWTRAKGVPRDQRIILGKPPFVPDKKTLNNVRNKRILNSEIPKTNA